MPITSILNQIKEQQVFLPAIQRDFVWEEDRVAMLLDSIMRGYPIGIVLLWETFQDIQYRHFEQHYVPDSLPKFHTNSRHRRIRVVLDGQQRLQSLYVALYGSYKGKSLYFDVLSGSSSDDFSEQKFIFRFGSSKAVEQWNAKPKKKRQSGPSDSESGPLQFFVKVEDLFQMSVQDYQKFRRQLVKQLKLSDADELRVETNIALFNNAMTKDENVLKASVIDENCPAASPERKTEADVLEIFVRINRQGTALSRSDLIFSMLKLNWQESAEALPQFVSRIAKNNSFALDTDFVIRCLFAVSDLGTRFDLDLLRKQSSVDKMKDNFQQCCDAIESTIDFVTDHCWLRSSKVLGGSATLIPFVYYVFHLPKRQIPNREIDAMRKSLYLFGFSQPFSRYADSRLAAFIREELAPLVEQGDSAFPFDASIRWVRYWEGSEYYDIDLLNGNPQLALHLVQQLTGAKVLYKNDAPQVDHIFPKSVLKKKKVDPAKIDDIANYWVLSKGKNQNKSSSPPSQYFKSVSAKELKRALIKRNLLDYAKFNAFLKIRRKAILAAVSKRSGLRDADFARALEDEE